MRAWPVRPAPDVTQPVTMLELFFDLVFVFTVTQLTDLVSGSQGASGYLQAGAVLAVTWWMYDGYAWLANNVGPTTTSTRLPMLVAMAGFLVMAIATPDAFGAAAWPFALSYLLVVVVHAAQFSRSSLGGSARAIRRILPVNLSVGLLLVAAAVIGAGWGWVCWLLAVLVLLGSVVVRRESGFAIRADHFAERHRLVVIIALGETVVATGAGAQGRLAEAWVLVAVLTSMALLSSLWWLYFGGDDERGAEALAAVPEDRMASVALRAYSLPHLLHVAGLVLVAAGLHEVVAAPGHHLSGRLAMTMAAGVATFMVGELLFARVLGIRADRGLGAAAVVALLVGPLGLLAGLAELAALLVVAVAAVVTGRTSSSVPG